MDRSATWTAADNPRPQRVPAGIVILGTALAAVFFAWNGCNLGLGVGGTALALVASAVMLLSFVLARGHFAAPVTSIQAFGLIIMTYVGVDNVLGVGRHSHGFATGASAWRMLRLDTIDLTLVAPCGVIHLARPRIVNMPALTSTPGGQVLHFPCFYSI